MKLTAAILVLAAGAAVSPPQKSSAWRPLFDGKTLDGWRGYKTKTVPAGWHVADGTIAKDKPTGDLVSKDEFDNFELELEWKIAEGGNGGIFYRGTEEYDHVYWSAPEYQLLTMPRRRTTRRGSHRPAPRTRSIRLLPDT